MKWGSYTIARPHRAHVLWQQESLHPPAWSFLSGTHATEADISPTENTEPYRLIKPCGPCQLF